MAERIERRTVLIYISPSCPHCVVVVPELSQLYWHNSEQVDFLCVFSGAARRGDVESFGAEQQLPIPWLHDHEREFADSTGLSSTPSVLVVQPPTEPDSGTVLVQDAYLPYIQGADSILEMRLLGSREPTLSRGSWLGAITCAGCHTEEARSWSMTHHAVAYYRLVEKGGVDQPACLGCHVTNLLLEPYLPGQPGQPTGFRTGDHRSPFADVSCEACHSASGPHDGQAGEPLQACAGCHADDHVPFGMERALPLIDHYGGFQVSDADMQAWRMSVALGEADRPLTRFPAEPSVGVRGCVSCHKPQARRWRKTLHAQAMDRLQGDEAEDLGCVSCHATPSSFAPVAESVADFRTDESVGCEACHGPDGGHGAAPEAVGSWSLHTRAPECFVEAICTRCHSETRDPDFELREALEAVAH